MLSQFKLEVRFGQIFPKISWMRPIVILSLKMQKVFFGFNCNYIYQINGCLPMKKKSREFPKYSFLLDAAI